MYHFVLCLKITKCCHPVFSVLKQGFLNHVQIGLLISFMSFITMTDLLISPRTKPFWKESSFTNEMLLIFKPD